MTQGKFSKEECASCEEALNEIMNLTKVRVFGKIKDSIIVEPLDVVETQKIQKMSKAQFKKEVKPIEQWSAVEWETAYNLLNAKFDKLKNKMRIALNELSKAQQHLSESVI